MGKSKDGIDKHCVGCKYYAEITKEMSYCSYIFREDKRRPCPPGKGCTVKKKGRPRKVFWEDRG